MTNKTLNPAIVKQLKDKIKQIINSNKSKIIMHKSELVNDVRTNMRPAKIKLPSAFSRAVIQNSSAAYYIINDHIFGGFTIDIAIIKNVNNYDMIVNDSRFEIEQKDIQELFSFAQNSFNIQCNELKNKFDFQTQHRQIDYILANSVKNK